MGCMRRRHTADVEGELHTDIGPFEDHLVVVLVVALAIVNMECLGMKRPQVAELQTLAESMIAVALPRQVQGRWWQNTALAMLLWSAWTLEVDWLLGG